MGGKWSSLSCAPQSRALPQKLRPEAAGSCWDLACQAEEAAWPREMELFIPQHGSVLRAHSSSHSIPVDICWKPAGCPGDEETALDLNKEFRAHLRLSSIFKRAF